MSSPSNDAYFSLKRSQRKSYCAQARTYTYPQRKINIATYTHINDNVSPQKQWTVGVNARLMSYTHTMTYEIYLENTAALKTKSTQ